MAMTMTGEVQLPASREVVWAMLNEPAVLKSCIPGCESLYKDSDTEFRAVATIKIGPVKARWKGKVRLSELDPPNGYRISGEGEGGVAGFAKGGATLSLADKDGGTLLSYNVEAQIGGKLAQLGQRLINSAAEDCRRFLWKFRRRRRAEGGVRFGCITPVLHIAISRSAAGKRPCRLRSVPCAQVQFNGNEVCGA